MKKQYISYEVTSAPQLVTITSKGISFKQLSLKQLGDNHIKNKK